MKIFNAEFLRGLNQKAMGNPRGRQHYNIHENYEDSCQRLFNAIEPGSYIQPHRHASDPREELLIAVRGKLALVTFDDHGAITKILYFGTEKHNGDLAIGAEVPLNTWHTVIALEVGCILLEVKAGPFDPNQPKDLAPWAPEEDSVFAQAYLKRLVELAGKPSGL